MFAGAAAFAGATVGLTSFAGATTPRVPSAPAAHPEGVSADENVAGYQATPPGGVSSASATFTIPKITCTKKQQAHHAQIELGVYTNDPVIFSRIGVGCTAGGPFYYYNVGTFSGVITEPATAGDTVVTSLSDSPTASDAEVHDLTNHQYWISDYTSPYQQSTVDIGSYDYFSPLGIPIAPFPTVTLSNATVNGDYLGFESPTRYNASDGTVTLVKSGGLKTSAAGSSFSLTFEHAS
jgi:hypothetical protein